MYLSALWFAVHPHPSPSSLMHTNMQKKLPSRHSHSTYFPKYTVDRFHAFTALFLLHLLTCESPTYFSGLSSNITSAVKSLLMPWEFPTETYCIPDEFPLWYASYQLFLKVWELPFFSIYHMQDVECYKYIILFKPHGKLMKHLNNWFKFAISPRLWGSLWSKTYILILIESPVHSMVSDT